MITVKKGDFEIVVTKDTFEKQLKPLGYQLASKETKGATEKVAPFVKEEEVEKENSLEEALEKIEESEEKEEVSLDEEFGFKKGKKGNK